MSFSTTPPIISTPSESGMTSSSSTSSRPPRSRASACTAAPSATTVSGSRSVSGSRPKSARTWRRTAGVRVVPPTSTTPSTARDAGVAQGAAAGAAGPLDDRLEERLQLRRVSRARSRCPSGSATSVSTAASAERVSRMACAAARAPRSTAGEGAATAGESPVASSRRRQHPVEVVAAQVGVAAGGQHLEDPVVEPQDGDVEGAAAEVVDRVGPLHPLVEAVGQRRRGRLVEQPQHVEPGQPRRRRGWPGAGRRRTRPGR